VQKHNLFLAERVACDSEFNRDDLLRFGIAEERLSVLHMPPAIAPPPHRERDSDVVELLFVGRFVPAKGVLDLVRAVVMAVAAGTTDMRVTLVGNPALSSAACLRDINELIHAARLESVVRIVPAPDQAALEDLYAGSDALVIPSYHEGYCMPVLEALLAQCHVIAYDAGNLPYIVNGLGTLVAAGDVQALSQAIAEFVARSHRSRREGSTMMVPTVHGPIAEDEWRRRVAAHLELHSRHAFEAGMAELLRWAAGRTGHDAVLRAVDHARAEAAVG
jgi:glycosyltransferase involved in cell wall biosynthesis